MEEQKMTKKQKRELKKQKRAEKNMSVGQKEKIKKYLVWGLFIFAIIAGFWWLKNNASINIPGAEVNESDHIKGNAMAKATLIEYADFQCPACKTYFTVIEALEKEYGDKVRIIYRHFPLTQIHKNGWGSAKVSEIAGAEGKFWKMHQKLYQNQSAWSGADSSEARDLFAGYAQEIGLDRDLFLKNFDGDGFEEKIRKDRDSGYALGIQGTPTFLLNGKVLENVPPDLEKFKELIDKILQ